MGTGAAAKNEKKQFRSARIEYWNIFVFISLLLGAAMRLIWVSDMEYKGDESTMFRFSQSIGVTESWPAVGMSSGPGYPNPGMSVWIFVVLKKLFSISNPMALARAVIVTNVLALVALLVFSLKYVKEEEKRAWMWAAALAAVSPTAILYHRKIWAQSILPIFCVFFVWSWRFRQTTKGAFFWGFFGALLGQFHMSGFFYSLGFFLWTLGFADRSRQEGKTNWAYWILGSMLGGIFLIPWLKILIGKFSVSRSPLIAGQFNFYVWKYWIPDPLGIGLDFNLGSDFRKFLEWPLIFGHPSYGVAIGHAAIIGLGILIYTGGIQGLWRQVKNLVTQRGSKNLNLANTDTGHACCAGFLGFGWLLTLSRFAVYRHYLIITFPLEWVMLSRISTHLIKKGQLLLSLLWVAQLFISIVLLLFLHQSNGAPGGDYGWAFHTQ